MTRRGRRRLRIALTVILCLLFQQVAVAAYVCALPSVPSAPAVVAGDCSEMDMEVVQEAPALCAEHCSPDQAIVADLSSPHVPPVALPPLQFAPIRGPPLTRVALTVQAPLNRSGPPPRLRYCSLLI